MSLNSQLREKMLEREIEIPRRLQPENLPETLAEKSRGYKPRSARKFMTAAGIAACAVITMVSTTLVLDSVFDVPDGEFKHSPPSFSDGGADEPDYPRDKGEGEEPFSVTEETVSGEPGGNSESPGFTAASSEETFTGSEQTVSGEPGEPSSNSLFFASDYKQVYDSVKKSAYYDREILIKAYQAGGGVYNEAPEDVPANWKPETDRSVDNGADNTIYRDDESSDFSGTNNQVEGVEEGDTVKTDGRNIYVVSSAGRYVSVVKANDGEMEKTAVLRKENASPIELLLYDGKLIVFWRKLEYNYEGDYYRYWGGGDEETVIEVYDAGGDFSAPFSSYSQKGGYYSSRMINGNIYLVTSYMPFVSTADFVEGDFDNYVPYYTVNGKKSYVKPRCIVLPERTGEYASYTVVAGLDVNSPELFVASRASFGNVSTVYSSLDNIFVAAGVWTEGTVYTDIAKFSLNGGNVEYVAAGRVPGQVNSQFCLDEYKGVLRVVSEGWGESGQWGAWEISTTLSTFDADLTPLASLTGIGKGERMQSARFYGDIAYIVTFMQTDPLFSFDLSDPKNPVKLDELKIPGFSRYMHKWNDGLLLGVGVDANEETGRRTGLKLSMFDVSNNSELSERHVYVINPYGVDNANYVSPAEYDHKAVLVSPDKNIIAVPYVCEIWKISENGWEYLTEGYSKYAVFSYDEQNGFTLKGEITHTSDYWDWGSAFRRGLFIGDYIYAISDAKIISASISDVKTVRELELN
ncbi:MAG: beta-propeller domain-containing protein [Oscillospiraceae bacterium]|jgi:uncharacterized secreted protein with C-terminal beta-propeller domain|nr:beta-propeller domain-containing protein [Oscillospiraceae bacterium]